MLTFGKNYGSLMNVWHSACTVRAIDMNRCADLYRVNKIKQQIFRGRSGNECVVDWRSTA